MNKYTWFVIAIIAIWVIGGVSAQVILVKPSEATIVNASILNVNSSDYWDDLDTYNTTQIENSGGILNILESWLNGVYCQLTGCTMNGDIDMGNNNITNSDTGFFTNLGSSVSRITKGWFTDLDVSGTVNATNLIVNNTLIVGSSGNFTICENSTQATYIGYFDYANCTQ